MPSRFSKILITIGLSVFTLAGTARADDATPVAPAPSTGPATRPSGPALRGHVTVSGRLSLSKIDLSRAVIYLASDPQLDAVPRASDHVSVEQKNKAFVPNFTVIPRGMAVEFPNWDSFDHNVFSRSKAAPAFDLDRYSRGQSKSRSFDKVGVIQVFCNIHPSMRAIIYVTPNVFFARADAGGNFQLSEVPPGHYELVVWHERCGEARHPVDVRAGSPEVSIVLSEDRQNIVTNDIGSHDSGYGVERGLGIKREILNLPVVKDAHAAPDPPK